MKATILLSTSVILAGVFFNIPCAQAQITPRGSMENFTLLMEDKALPVVPEIVAGWKNTVITRVEVLAYGKIPTVKKLTDMYAGITPFSFTVPSPSKKIVYYDVPAIYDFLKLHTDSISAQVQEPFLQIENNRAVTFTPPADGLQPDLYTTTFNVVAALENDATSTKLSETHIRPTTQLAQTNTLGINELIAEGVSSFKGSPSNRRHNIKVGVEKMKGVIIAPGEEFSFNKFLGDVDGQHGFLPELVIKNNNTIPEFGGGLCQVSSTTFRAAMQAGFPITQRRNHAYAVQYYAPQGTDATIYPGVIDLKFINDSPESLLVWPYFKDDNTLVFDFYGTKDDRQVIVEKPVQYDKKSTGAMKATWQREVTKDGQTRTDVFKSTYQPAALFHHTQEFASSSPPSDLHVGTQTQ